MLHYDPFVRITRGIIGAIRSGAPKSLNLSKETIEALENAILKTVYVYATLMAQQSGKPYNEVYEACGLPKLGKQSQKLVERMINFVTEPNEIEA